MATDGPDPEPCNREIYLNGEQVALAYGPSNATERWVKRVDALAQAMGAKVDWHYVGGRANVLCLGTPEAVEWVKEHIKTLPAEPEPGCGFRYRRT